MLSKCVVRHIHSLLYQGIIPGITFVKLVTIILNYSLNKGYLIIENTDKHLDHSRKKINSQTQKLIIKSSAPNVQCSTHKDSTLTLKY